MKHFLTIAFLACIVYCSPCTSANWFGGAVGLGHEQPYTNFRPFNMSVEDANNQLCPLFLNDEGEYIWTEYPVIFSFENGEPQFQTPNTKHQSKPAPPSVTLILPLCACISRLRAYYRIRSSSCDHSTTHGLNLCIIRTKRIYSAMPTLLWITVSTQVFL